MSDGSRPPNHSRPPLEVLLEALETGYVGVHVEQGVPVLDRDLNLLGDLLHATLRRIVTRYIGDGVATGSEAFAIGSVDGDNDFEIGAGAEPPGRCLVGGIEVVIDAPVRYREQAGDALPELTTPGPGDPDPRVDAVYLDVWLEEEAGEIDGGLLNPDDVGGRTSTRAYPTWRVRVSEDGQAPDPDAGHVHYLIARLHRPRDADQIEADHITDQRRTHLNLADLEARVTLLERLPDRLLDDLFELEPDEYERGGGRPQVSVRHMLNALIRGEMAGSPPQSLSQEDGVDLLPHAAIAPDRTLHVVWTRRLPRNDDDEFAWAVMMTRLGEDGIAESPRQVSPDFPGDEISLTVYPTWVLPFPDKTLVAYRRDLPDSSSDGSVVRFKIGPTADLPSADEHPIEPLDGKDNRWLCVIATGNLVTFLVNSEGAVVYMRLRHTEQPDRWWIDDEPRKLDDSRPFTRVAGVADSDGRIWVAFEGGGIVNRVVKVMRLDPQSGTIDGRITREDARNPTLHRMQAGQIHLLWYDDDEDEFRSSQFDGSDWRDAVSLPSDSPDRSNPVAVVEGGDASLWAFWGDGSDGQARVLAARHEPGSAVWTPARLAASQMSAMPVAVSRDGNSATLFYHQFPPTWPEEIVLSLHHREIVTVF